MGEEKRGRRRPLPGTRRPEVGVSADEHAEPDRNEEAPRQAEGFSRSVLDALCNHIAVLDASGKIVAVNKAWRDFARANPPLPPNISEDVNYLAICDSATGPSSEGAADFAAGIRAIMRGELDEYALEYPCHSPWEQRWFVGRATRLPGEGPAAVVVSHENITRCKLAEEALRQSQDRYRNLVETTSDWAWEVDEHALYTYVSPKVRELLGYEPEELIGKTPFDLMPPEEARRVAEIFGPIAARCEPFKAIENTNRRKDGRLVVLETSGVPFFDAEGQFRGYRGIDRDITQRKQAEQFREEYLSLISHDLRAPLTVILGQAGWLRRLLEQKHLQRETESLDAILKNTRQMNSMIHDLVETARLESGRLEIRKRPVDLVALVADVAGRVGTLQDRSRLHVEPAEPMPPVPLDPERIERVLVNLLTNALKYSPPDSPVAVRVGQRDGDAAVTVADRGAGIPPADLPHVFERFYRARTGKKAEGLGLGLYICRLIVEAHGGRIWAESRLGQGSTFTFALPLG